MVGRLPNNAGIIYTSSSYDEAEELADDMTTAEKIFAANDREGMEVKAWGQTLYVHPMSGADLDSYDSEMYEADKDGRKHENFRARYLVRCLCDEHGNRVFSNEDAEKLGKKSASTLRRLFKVASEINGKGEDGIDAAAKNS